MKKSLFYAFVAFILFLAKGIIYGLLTGSTQINELAALGISCTIILTITFLLIGNKDGFKYYGICIGRKAEFISVNIIVFIIPLINIPYLINPVKNNLIYILLSGLYVGIMEEIIFRGFLYRAIEEKFNKNKAIIISSIIFGLIHFINIGSAQIQFVVLQVVYATAIGIIFAVIFSMTQSLFLCIVVHALTDILSFYCQEPIAIVEFSGTIICIICALYYWYLWNRNKSLMN
jgi:membrane protease YdiL (CAAX protease family)